jgi:aminoglycoside phosphotransferase (APT) family kinase protein
MSTRPHNLLTGLSWEMSTIGHPLSDLNNLLLPFVTATNEKAIKASRANPAFAPGATPGLPPRDQLISWYAEAAGWDPTPDMTWGAAFGLYRGSIIMQGIAARYALRQASSTKAQEYGSQMKPFAEIAWDLVRDCKRTYENRAKL